MFDELFDPEGLRIAYITIVAAHIHGYRYYIHTRSSNSSALKCVHVQELPTHHVRTEECRRLCPISRGRFRFCEFVSQSYGWNKFAPEAPLIHIIITGKKNVRLAGQDITSDRYGVLAVQYCQHCGNVDPRENSWAVTREKPKCLKILVVVWGKVQRLNMDKYKSALFKTKEREIIFNFILKEIQEIY